MFHAYLESSLKLVRSFLIYVKRSHCNSRLKRGVGAVLFVSLFGFLFPPQIVVAKDPPKANSNGADVGHWKTFVIKSGDQLRIAPPEHRSPPSNDELSQIVTRQAQLTPEWKAKIAYWDEGAITRPWSELLLKKIVRYRMNPIRASRAIALLHVAIYDAIVACWDAKMTYRLESPVQTSSTVRALVNVPDYPSFPSEHAAVASAAVAVLTYLFPWDEAEFRPLAEEAGTSRVLAGANFPSDVEAGNRLGTAVGKQVIDRGKNDRSEMVLIQNVPTGSGYWRRPSSGVLVEPMAGDWRTWILSSGKAVKIIPPPPFGSEAYQAEVAEMIDVAAGLTKEQKGIADFWADGGGTVTPPGHWLQVAGEMVNQIYRDDPPRAARALALVSVSAADAFISCWYYKYLYWTPRPNQVIPGFTAYIRTPPFPGYPSGHSTLSGAASEVLAYLFPDRAEEFRNMAEEAAVSRLYGGIHFRSDNDNGLTLGREIGRRVVDYARQDGPNDD